MFAFTRLRLWLLVLGGLSFLPLCGRVALAEDSAPAADPAAAERAVLAFDRLYGEWRVMAIEIRRLQVDYLTASEERRASLRRRYTERVERGEKLYSELKDQAALAIRNSPQQRRADIERLVSYLVFAYTVNDDYEQAQRTLADLGANEFKDPRLYDLAGFVSMMLGEGDRARRMLEIAEQKNAFNEDTKEALKKLGGMAGLTPLQEHWKHEQEIRTAEEAADDLPRVLLTTSQGDITLELFENEAPNTVANFVNLVEAKFYDGLTFHRVLSGFVAQGGDPLGNGKGGPGYHIACECNREDFRRHFRGGLSMAHAGKDTGGSQFFLMFRPCPHLDGKHTVFGRVIDGIDVLAKIQRIDPEKDTSVEPDRIISAKVLRKRDHAYEPEKLP